MQNIHWSQIVLLFEIQDASEFLNKMYLKKTYIVSHSFFIICVNIYLHISFNTSSLSRSEWSKRTKRTERSVPFQFFSIFKCLWVRNLNGDDDDLWIRRAYTVCVISMECYLLYFRFFFIAPLIIFYMFDVRNTSVVQSCCFNERKTK